jgi:hypothetical protein
MRSTGPSYDRTARRVESQFWGQADNGPDQQRPAILGSNRRQVNALLRRTNDQVLPPEAGEGFAATMSASRLLASITCFPSAAPIEKYHGCDELLST